MKKLSLLVLFVLFLSPLRAQDEINLESSLVLGFEYPKRVDLFDTRQVDRLLTKVNKILTNYGVSAGQLNANLVVRPEIEIFESQKMDGLRELHVVKAEFSLFIGQRKSLHFLSYDQTIQGTGRSKKQAVSSILNKIKTQSPSLERFFNEAKVEIATYYQENCENILSEADKLASTNRYNEAISLLWSIPSMAPKCHFSARDKILGYYKEQQNRDCFVYLNRAEANVALGKYEAAAQWIVQIDPEANCYGKATALKKKITKATGERLKRIWEYENKLLDVVSDNIQAKYGAIASIGKAVYTQNTQQNTTYPKAGQSALVVNQNVSSSDNSRSNSSVSSQPKQPVETNDGLFRVMVPIVNAQRQVELVGERLTVEGKIDNPESASKLLIDGLETSWDKDGVFQRDLLIKEDNKEIAVELVNKRGQNVRQKFTVRRKEDANAPVESPPKVPAGDLKKVALIIGNDNYQSTKPLRNAVNDADDMNRALVQLGFQVKRITNADLKTMKTEILDFGQKTEGANVTFFYYAGHGLEVDGENYLVPVDASINVVSDVAKNTVNLSWVLRMVKFTNDNNLNIMVLDACRNNPFPNGKRGGGGLSKVEPPAGMLVAYSTEPGSVASDGKEGNGLYTGELIRQMNKVQRIEDVFMNTRNEVERISAGNQRPWETARLRNVFYLKYKE
ncbi:MAG: hypothetical protein Roseis2KO_17010 [Roseivirga sp.]